MVEYLSCPARPPSKLPTVNRGCRDTICGKTRRVSQKSHPHDSRPSGFGLFSGVQLLGAARFIHSPRILSTVQQVFSELQSFLDQDEVSRLAAIGLGEGGRGLANG